MKNISEHLLSSQCEGWGIASLHESQLIIKDQVRFGWHGRSMCYNNTIRSETREAWNNNCMDAGGVLFFLVDRAVCACIYVMVVLLLLCYTFFFSSIPVYCGEHGSGI